MNTTQTINRNFDAIGLGCFVYLVGYISAGYFTAGWHRRNWYRCDPDRRECRSKV